MERTNLVLDSMLFKLLSFNHIASKPNSTNYYPHFSNKKVIGILKAAQNMFMEEDTLLNLKSPIKIVGDLHGQFFDLLRLLEFGGYPPQNRYLFMGNYVNGGNQGIEVFLLLILLKIKYPQSIYLLRGNNESNIICYNYQFFRQCQEKYNISIYKAFIQCFNYLPLAAVVSNSILCVHGGLSPKIKYLTDILALKRPIEEPEAVPICDLLWSDPSESVFFWGNNIKRNIGCQYGISSLEQFLMENKLQLLCRSNEVINSGYKFSFRSRVITIFSSPNYLNYYKNSGSMFVVKEDLQCRVLTLRVRRRKMKSLKKKVQTKEKEEKEKKLVQLGQQTDIQVGQKQKEREQQD